MVLKGVPTDTVLGLLCAVGTFRILDEAWPDQDVRMAWRNIEGAWRPCLWVDAGTLVGSEEERQAQVVTALDGHLSREDAPWFTLAKDPRMTLAEFEAAVRGLSSLQPTDRQAMTHWLPALGCELPGETHKKKGALISDTDLSMMREASQQQMLKSMQELASCCTPVDLHNALFTSWTYSDPKPYLRLDPRDDRTAAAYQAYDPQDRDGKNAMSPITTVRGANRLATEAFPMFPTAPQRSGLATTAFYYARNETALRFPLWHSPITCTSLRWLLKHPELVAENPDREILASIGVSTVLHAVRNQTDKGSRSFLPVVAIG